MIDLEAHADWMMDHLQYRFTDIDEWNKFRDALIELLKTLDQTRLTN